MKYCENCGSLLPEGKLTCPECGAKQTPPTYGGQAYSGQYAGGRAAGGYSSPEPAYSYAPPQQEPERVLGVGAFFGSALLMRLPVIGLIMQIIWAAGGTSSLNRRNMARAYLIFTVIGIVLGVLAYLLVVYIVLPQVMELLDAYGYKSGFGYFWQG